jgi:hypothetical protein
MKRNLSILLALFLLAGLSGCAAGKLQSGITGGTYEGAEQPPMVGQGRTEQYLNEDGTKVVKVVDYHAGDVQGAVVGAWQTGFFVGKEQTLKLPGPITQNGERLYYTLTSFSDPMIVQGSGVQTVKEITGMAPWATGAFAVDRVTKMATTVAQTPSTDNSVTYSASGDSSTVQVHEDSYNPTTTTTEYVSPAETEAPAEGSDR